MTDADLVEYTGPAWSIICHTLTSDAACEITPKGKRGLTTLIKVTMLDVNDAIVIRVCDLSDEQFDGILVKNEDSTTLYLKPNATLKLPCAVPKIGALEGTLIGPGFLRTVFLPWWEMCQLFFSFTKEDGTEVYLQPRCSQERSQHYILCEYKGPMHTAYATSISDDKEEFHILNP